MGGNDLSLLVEQCAGNRACVTNGLPALLGTLERNLKTIYAGIRDDGHYRGRVIALTLYPTPLDNPPAPMPRYGDADAVGVTNAVNRVVAAATVAAGGRVADGFGAFRAASGAFGEDPCAAGLLLRPSVPGQPCDPHPSASGRDVLARAIQALAIEDASAVLPRAGDPAIPVTMAIGLGFLLLIGGWALRRPGLSPQLLAMHLVPRAFPALPAISGVALLARSVRRLRIALVLVATVPALVACTLGRAAGAEGGEVWVTSQGTHRLFVVQGQTVAETLELPAGTGPHIITFSPDGRYAYVGGMGNGDLDILRADERRVVATVKLGAAGTHQAKPSPDGTVVLVSQLASKSLIKVTADPAAETWRVAGALKLEVLGKTPICTVFRDDGERAYVSLLPNGIAVVDVATMTLRDTLATDGFVACGMIKAKDGKTVTLAAAGGGGHVYRLDTATDELSDAGTLGAASWHSFNLSPNEQVGYGTSPMSDELVLADLRTATVGPLGTVKLDPTAGVGSDQPDAIAVRGDTVFVSLRASGKLAIVQANQRTATYIDISAPTPFDPATCAGCAVHGVTVRPDGR
jgi:DNA-binding beta-propeller fold protein YncE